MLQTEIENHPNPRVAEILALKAEVKRVRYEKKLQLKDYKDKHGVEFFRPFKWQEDMLEIVRQKNIAITASPNKIGKCLCFQTLIDTPSGEISVGELYEKGEPFDVYAWNGKKKVVAKALTPFKKEGVHKCYRIEMSDGRVIEAADYHRILTLKGWRSVDSLYKSFPNLRESIGGISPSTHVSGEDRLSRKQSDCQGGYLGNPRQYDGQPLSYQDNVPIYSPLRDDAQESNVPLLHWDDLANKGKRILRLTYDRLSSLYALIRYEARYVAFLFRTSCTEMKPAFAGCSISYQLSNVVDHEPPLTLSTSPQCLDNSYTPPLYIDPNHMISISPIGSQEVYDFTVEKYHNYFAGGLIHHNTVLGACTVISVALGYEPWTKVDAGYPGAVKVGKKYCKPSPLGTKPPVRIRITGEDWTHHIGQTIVPELKKWSPEGQYVTKKNSQGVEYLWTWKNGSTFEILTHDQEDKLFESWLGNFWWADEPPPQSKYAGMSRGLFTMGGKIIIFMTPLKEVWILDELIESGRADVGTLDGLTILDNDVTKNLDDAVLSSCGLDDFQKKTYYNLLLDNPDKGKSAEEYLREHIPYEQHDDILLLRLLRFVKDCLIEDRETRLFGKFKELVGRVLKEYKPDVHLIDPFEIPVDWPVVPMIDFHLSTPQAVSFWTADERDIYLAIDEVWSDISAEEIGNVILRKKAQNNWNIRDVYIDPLSKGDSAYMKNRLGDVEDSFTILQNKLAPYGIMLHVASKDKTSGIRNLRERLEGFKGIPSIFLFNTLERHQYEIRRWILDDKGLPSKDVHEHFMENAYRFTLTGTRYLPVDDEDEEYEGKELVSNSITGY